MMEVASPEALRPWLAMVRAPGLGACTFQRLAEAGLTAETLLGLSDERLQTLGLPPAARAALLDPDWSQIDADLAWARELGRTILTLDDPRYPPQLREIANPPPVLFVTGDPALLALPQVAIVGSRNPTPAGEDSARAFAAALVESGCVITSGLALGIDGAAHRGALEAGGATVAVCGTGPERVYPARHRDLAGDVARRGVLISEFPTGTPVRPQNFPQRNRIISGLSLGVLVVEAALHSGSLLTARCALDQGREVFALPGSIHNPLARGCHALIREGAKLVEHTAHILEELQLAAAPPPAARPARAPEPGIPERDGEYQALLESLGHDPATVDVLVHRTGLTAKVVSSMLLVLELEGYVDTRPGGAYVRNPTRV